MTDETPIPQSHPSVFHVDLPPIRGHILSIQSHVVFGYVGNKVAKFVLEHLGYQLESDFPFVSSFVGSNHTGYASHKGKVLSGTDLFDLYVGLQENKLISDLSHVLTGYIGSAQFLSRFLEIITELKSQLPKLMYVCDPVLGDVVPRDGKLVREIYVPAELVDIYREQVLPLADVAAPNYVEAEILSGIEMRSELDVRRVLKWFHDKGPKRVVITSILLPENVEPRTETTNATNTLALYASCRREGEEEDEVFRIKFPELNGIFSGCGDLMTALIAAWVSREDQFDVALEKALNSVQLVLENSPVGELKLVQCARYFEEPEIVFRAEKLGDDS